MTDCRRARASHLPEPLPPPDLWDGVRRRPGVGAAAGVAAPAAFTPQVQLGSRGRWLRSGRSVAAIGMHLR